MASWGVRSTWFDCKGAKKILALLQRLLRQFQRGLMPEPRLAVQQLIKPQEQ